LVVFRLEAPGSGGLSQRDPYGIISKNT